MSNSAPPAEQEQSAGWLPTLAPLDDLNPDDANFKAYYNHLHSIFSNPTLRNIAVIGNRGSGKSSILRSYDRHRPDKAGDFLFVSLIDFETQTQPGGKTPPVVQPDNRKDSEKKIVEDKTETKKAQRLEYSLLCQILARCTAQDLEGSSLSAIPTTPVSLARVPSYLVFLFLISFPLTFHEPFGALLGVMGVPDVGRIVIRGLCYALLAIILSIGLSWLLKSLLPQLRLQKFTLKGTHTQVELALDSGKHCLDQFKFELIYILSRISDKIGCTVVFEDMERLDSSVCIEIMTKLRELNTLVNIHRQTQAPGLVQKPIRFLYAMSDEVFDCEIRTKFFDFIMPVIPALNATNAEQVLKNRLHDTQTKVDREHVRKLIPIIAPHLTDYRTLRSVLGEYQMLRHLYAASNDDLEEYRISDTDSSRLLALAVYKVLFPQEYHTAFTETGNAILPLPSTGKYKPGLTAMVTNLFDEGYLDNTTLRMIGYSEAQIKDQWWEILMRGDYCAKSSLLFRFLHTHSPDEKAFRDVIRTAVEYQSIFDQEESINIARWIGEFYFEEPDVILEQFIACKPSDYTPYAFINHLSCLANFHTSDLARTAVAIGQQKISNALLLYLQHLDLEISPEQDPVRAEEWASEVHVDILFHLLGHGRDNLASELLDKKIGSTTLRELHGHYHRIHCLPVHDRYRNMHQLLKIDSPEPLFYSSYDMCCLETMIKQRLASEDEQTL